MSSKVIKGFFKKAKKAEPAASAGASSTAASSTTSVAVSSSAASDAWIEEVEGPSTTDVLPSKLGQRVAELSLDELVDADAEEAKPADAESAWSAVAGTKAGPATTPSAPTLAAPPKAIGWRERNAERAANPNRVDIRSTEAFPTLGGGPTPAPAPAPRTTGAWGNKYAALSTADETAVPSAESPSTSASAAAAAAVPRAFAGVAGAPASAAGGASGVATGSAWGKKPAAVAAATTTATGGAGASAPAPVAASSLSVDSVTEGDLVNSVGSKPVATTEEAVRKEAAAIMRELSEVKDVKEAVTRFTELRCSPLSLRSFALDVLVDEALEAPSKEARAAIGKVLAQLVLPAKAVTVGWIRASFGRLFEAERYGDLKSDYPQLDAYVAEVLGGGACVPALIPVDMLPPSVATRMGLAAAAKPAAAPAPTPAPAPAPVAAAPAPAAEEGGDDGFMAASVKKKKKAIKTFE